MSFVLFAIYLLSFFLSTYFFTFDPMGFSIVLLYFLFLYIK